MIVTAFKKQNVDARKCRKYKTTTEVKKKKHMFAGLETQSLLILVLLCYVIRFC